MTEILTRSMAPATVVDDKTDYRPAVKQLLDHHFEAMGIRPSQAEFAAVQGAIVHLLDHGTQHPDILAAVARVQAEADDQAKQRALAIAAAKNSKG